MGYKEMDSRFPTEEDCINYIFKLRWPEGYYCPRCNCNENWKISASKYKCRKCKYQTTVTAGTIFHHTHISLRQWFQAIWFMSMQGRSTTAVKLEEEIKVGNRTAQTMVKRIRSLMFSTDEKIINRRLNGRIDICIKESPDKNSCSHILTAVEMKNQKGGNIRLYQMPNYDSESYQKFLSDNVEPGSILRKEGGHWKIRLDNNKRYVVPEAKSMVHYKAPYANAVYNNFRKYWDKYAPKDNGKNLSAIMEEYSRSINSAQEHVDFEIILRNAVNHEPLAIS